MNESQNFEIVSCFNNIDMTKIAYIIDDGQNMGVIKNDNSNVNITWYGDHKFSYLETIAENFINEIE